MEIDLPADAPSAHVYARATRTLPPPWNMMVKNLQSIRNAGGRLINRLTGGQMRWCFFGLLALAGAVRADEPNAPSGPPIRVETAHAALVFATGANGRVFQVQFGARPAGDAPLPKNLPWPQACLPAMGKRFHRRTRPPGHPRRRQHFHGPAFRPARNQARRRRSGDDPDRIERPLLPLFRDALFPGVRRLRRDRTVDGNPPRRACRRHAGTFRLVVTGSSTATFT